MKIIIASLVIYLLAAFSLGSVTTRPSTIPTTRPTVQAATQPTTRPASAWAEKVYASIPKELLVDVVTATSTHAEDNEAENKRSKDLQDWSNKALVGKPFSLDTFFERFDPKATVPIKGVGDCRFATFQVAGRLADGTGYVLMGQALYPVKDPANTPEKVTKIFEGMQRYQTVCNISGVNAAPWVSISYRNCPWGEDAPMDSGGFLHPGTMKDKPIRWVNIRVRAIAPTIVIKPAGVAATQRSSEDAAKDQAALLEQQWEALMDRGDAGSTLLFIERRDETVCNDPAGILVKVHGIAVRETHLGDNKDQVRRQAFVLVSYTNNTGRDDIVALAYHFLSNSFSKSVAGTKTLKFNGKDPTAGVVGLGLRDPDLAVDELKKEVRSIAFTKWAVTSLSTADGKTIQLSR